MLINVGAEFGKNLETSEIAIELVEKISEINISDEIRVIMGAADEACNP